jgi:uncharacterized protein
MRRKSLIIMVKVPEAGRVKTRLARGVGLVRATQFYRVATARLLRRLASPGEWSLVLAVTPDAGVDTVMFPTDVDRVAQGRGDLGQRMQRLMDGMPPGPIVIIGSDVPAIKPHHIRDAFRALGSHDAAIGPCPDGGYWLIGLKRLPRVPQAFGNVRWSSEHARSDTLRNLQGLRIATLPTLADIDEAIDLEGYSPYG